MQNKDERGQKLQMITDWQQSGLSQKAFYAAHNIGYHTFHYWYKVYKSGRKTTDCFLPLSVSEAANPEYITLKGDNGISVQIPLSGQTAGFVKQLLLS